MNSPPAIAEARGAQSWKVALLALGVAGILGAIGYKVGFLGFVYGIMVPGTLATYSAYTLAVVIGVAAFFSPCAFPLLPAYVSYAFGVQGGGDRSVKRSLRLGAFAAGGVLIVVLAIGLLIAALRAATPFQPDPRQDEPWILGIRVAAGGAIAIFGLLTLMGRSSVLSRSLGWLKPRGTGVTMGRGRSAERGMFLYGLGYSSAGIGCTGPLLLALMLTAFASASPFVSFGAFAIFASTMAFLMLFVTLLVGLAKRRAVDRLRTAAPSIQRVAGAAALIAGVWTIYSVTWGMDLFIRWFFRFLPGA